MTKELSQEEKDITKVPIEEKWNKDGYLVSMKVNGHVIDIPEQNQPSVIFMNKNLKNAEWVTEKFYLTPEEAKQRYPELLTPIEEVTDKVN